MPVEFTNRPPPVNPFGLWRYEPITPGHDLLGCVATNLVGVNTHWSGQTVPCLGSDCPLCDQGKEARWTGYLGLLGAAGARRLVLMPASTAHRWGEFMVVGNLLRFSRPKARSALMVEVVREKPEDPELAEDLRPVLLHMWRRALPSGKLPGSDSSCYVTDSASQHRRQDGPAPKQPAPPALDRSPSSPDFVPGFGDIGDGIDAVALRLWPAS